MLDQQKLHELTSKLINFKSISPNQDGCIDYLQQVLTDSGFTISRVDRNNTSNLIARIGNTGPLFAYAGHIDVVPTGDISQWNFDPFTLSEQDNKLFGRGIADMKGSVAAFIIAVTKFIKQDFFNPDNGQIAILITSDEEASATDGTPVIVEYLKSQNIIIDYCLIGEPSSANLLGDSIKVGRRGSLTGFIEVQGKQGHIAYPELCINPIHTFAPALNELILTKWDNGNNIFPPTSLQIANINAGLGVTNVIANTLTSSFNFRYNNLYNANDLKQKVVAILNKHDIKYTIKWVNSAKPFYTDPGKLLKVVTKSIKQQLGLTPQQKTDGGTSDGRFLIEICNEIIEFGLSNKYIHQINEHINTKDLYDLAKTYYLILNKIFND
ncbi:MAG: succinyl-diaminopimelate desuccinylase [Burkholderiales bacterium]|jgi:succinyl-diaminopimelate desuccinylase|nr:succinyl-diaminopimelate desuccinylase [Burkholderiales bacterium]